MSTTTSTYLGIEKNLALYQKVETDQPAVKTATAYYQTNIGKVTTASQLVGNYRLLSYALQAYGLGDQINNKALIKQVLQQGTASPKALANTLPNANWKAFANAFNFLATGSAAPSSSASVATTTSDYVEQQLEADQGASDPGVELALYFKRVAPTVKSTYGILADKNLLEVVQTIFNLPAATSASQIDSQAAAVSKLVPIAELKNPAELERLVQRFAAAYDVSYGSASGSSLAVDNGNVASTVSAASSILSGIVSANAIALAPTSTYTPLISPSLLASLKLGG